MATLFAHVVGAQAGPESKSAACNQAESIVEEVKRQWGSGQPDHKMALARLSTARDLCPTLGDAWKYSYCSASALKDEKRARIYRDRAIFNGVARVECTATSDSPPPLSTRVRDKYALLVGISKFANTGIPSLKFAAKDASDLKRLLVDPQHGRFNDDENHVHLLVDKDATRANILSALNQIALEATEDDLILLFFSSHGSPRADNAGLQGIGYITTYDTDPKQLFVNSLEFDDLQKKLSVIAARRKILLLDTCFSGQVKGKGIFVENVGVEEATARAFLSGVGSYVITSSQANEISYESDALQNGFFTYFLIDALKRGGEPPTISQVFSKLREGVRDAVARELHESQNPRMFPEDGLGDVRIGVVPSR